MLEASNHVQFEETEESDSSFSRSSSTFHGHNMRVVARKKEAKILPFTEESEGLVMVLQIFTGVWSPEKKEAKIHVP